MSKYAAPSHRESPSSSGTCERSRQIAHEPGVKAARAWVTASASAIRVTTKPAITVRTPGLWRDERAGGGRGRLGIVVALVGPRGAPRLGLLDPVAQRIERQTSNLQVEGSSPSGVAVPEGPAMPRAVGFRHRAGARPRGGCRAAAPPRPVLP